MRPLEIAVLVAVLAIGAGLLVLTDREPEMPTLAGCDWSPNSETYVCANGTQIWADVADPR